MSKPTPVLAYRIEDVCDWLGNGSVAAIELRAVADDIKVRGLWMLDIWGRMASQSNYAVRVSPESLASLARLWTDGGELWIVS